MERLINNFRDLIISTNNDNSINDLGINELVSYFRSLSINSRSDSLLENIIYNFRSLQIDPSTKEKWIEVIEQAIKSMLCKPKCIPIDKPTFIIPNYIY